MTPLDLVKLTALMERTSGSPELTDRAHRWTRRYDTIPSLPISTSARSLETGALPAPRPTVPPACTAPLSRGFLSAKRGSVAPAICPNCTLLVRPIFAETTAANGEMPSATPEELAQAILDCHRRGRSRAERQRRPRPTLHQKRAGVGRGSGPGRQARGDRDRGGGQSGNPRQHCHHPPPVGHPGGGL